MGEAFKRDKDSAAARKKRQKRVRSSLSSLLLVHPWLEPSDPKGALWL